MIARLDHHPMLTALLALSTAVLVVVVVTLATLLITAAPSSNEGGANPVAPAAVAGTGENYGEGWKNYGYDAEHAATLQQPAKTGNGADSAIDRHAEVVAAYQNRW